ncbi:hypothetical protein SM19_04515, partial [Klebsiella pneumoniae]
RAAGSVGNRSTSRTARTKGNRSASRTARTMGNRSTSRTVGSVGNRSTPRTARTCGKQVNFADDRDCGKQVNFADDRDCGKQVNSADGPDCGKQVNYADSRDCGKQVKLGKHYGKHSKFSIPPYVSNKLRGEEIKITDYCFLSRKLNSKRPSSSVVYVTFNGVFSLIFFRAGSRKVRFISAILFFCEAGSINLSHNQSCVVIQTPVLRN